jgi:hypothetical protein
MRLFQNFSFWKTNLACQATLDRVRAIPETNIKPKGARFGNGSYNIFAVPVSPKAPAAALPCSADTLFFYKIFDLC